MKIIQDLVVDETLEPEYKPAFCLENGENERFSRIDVGKQNSKKSESAKADKPTWKSVAVNKAEDEREMEFQET